MFIRSEEYDVLSKSIEQTFNDCDPTSGATLFVKQRDVRLLFLKLSKKFAQVRCNSTGRVLKQRHWNEQTKIDAENLLAQHKVSKAGWYIIGFILVALPIAIIMGVSKQSSDAQDLNDSFSFQEDAEKKRLVSTLGEGDYFMTSSYVYKIKRITDTSIIVYKGNAVTNILEPIAPQQEIDTTNEITLNKKAFLNRITVSTGDEFGGDMIFNILDN